MGLDRVLQYCDERGIDPALLGGKDWAGIVEELLTELETLRRVRHVARSHRYAEIECMSDFGAEPRMRSWHTRLELDRLLGIEEDLQGLA
jgi:hypothetical protein